MAIPDFLTLATFRVGQQTEAYLLKARLDEADVNCILSGTNQFDFGDGFVIQIPPHEEKRALRIMREFEKKPDARRFPVQHVDKIVIAAIVALLVYHLVGS